jgi:hypothetical protein
MTSLDPPAVEARWKPQGSREHLQRFARTGRNASKRGVCRDPTCRDRQLRAHGKEGVIGSSPMLGSRQTACKS